ncbi:GAF and ANTAR domain-containing protein [Actinomycetospora sp. TBRC 11914]|uniref:GAF and ANTAR domain-containing protein n=1 Tax=Actinomycetospora sp. TBRC 11914 TaxID=2729387 RepID=UPI00145DEE25|nr:GAF and ANTAR domain-containing protein [Actinomycetospora sp. TBRC 11914]NMO93090.1 GAF and ANTAR domain-containing protein [Actinomycetospora sp. TBRC 11914]
MDTGNDERLVIALRTAVNDLTGHRSIRDLEQVLGQVVASAVETIPAVDAGSISMIEQGHVETRHPTSDLIGRLDDTQSELGEGPCLSAIEDPPESGLVVAQDLGGDDAHRWPKFSAAAVEMGFRGLMSTQLTTEGGMRGALNLYAREPHAFDEHSRTLAGLFGVQAALLLYGASQARHLQRAVDSRDLIGRAKGILAERFGVDDDTAFQMLVKSSQDTNMKLTAVAQWLTENTGGARVRPGTAD